MKPCPHYPHLIHITDKARKTVELKAAVSDLVALVRKAKDRRMGDFSSEEIRRQGFMGEFAVSRIYGLPWHPSYGGGSNKEPDFPGVIPIEVKTVAPERGVPLTETDIDLLRRFPALRVVLVWFSDIPADATGWDEVEVVEEPGQEVGTWTTVRTPVLGAGTTAATVWGWVGQAEVRAHGLKDGEVGVPRGFRVRPGGRFVPKSSVRKTCPVCEPSRGR